MASESGTVSMVTRSPSRTEAPSRSLITSSNRAETSKLSAPRNSSWTRCCSPSTSIDQGVSSPSRRRTVLTTSRTLSPWSASTSRLSEIRVSSLVVRPKRSEPVMRGLRTRRLRSTLASVRSAISVRRLEL